MSGDRFEIFFFIKIHTYVNYKPTL